MGKLIPISRFREVRVASPVPSLQRPELELPAARGEPPADQELWPIAVLLWVFSLARVVHALLRHELFDLECTLALACLLGLPCSYWRFRLKTR
jgi:hypothetical protein